MAAAISAILIKNRDPEAYNLGTIVQNPRGCTSIDVAAAASNLVFEPVGACASSEHCALVLDLVRFLFQDFFNRSHQTGLYNRQMRLWQVFSKVERVEFKQLEGGFFSRNLKPALQVAFKSQTGHVLFQALVVLGGTDQFNLVQDFLTQAAKIQGRQGSYILRGIFIVQSEPSELEKTRQYLLKATNGEDPVARYDSCLPSPFFVHANLLSSFAVSESVPVSPGTETALEEVDPAGQETDDQHAKELAQCGESNRPATAFRLVHPSLSRLEPVGKPAMASAQSPDSSA